jgi:hypothetical protein
MYWHSLKLKLKFTGPNQILEFIFTSITSFVMGQYIIKHKIYKKQLIQGQKNSILNIIRLNMNHSLFSNL